MGGTVTFSKPVSAYVEDFLGFPVGMKVPLGVLDAKTTSWVPQPDGRVVKVLSVSGGAATIDANGDGAPDPQIVLDSLGFTTTELQQLAASYTPGATLMRTRLFGLYPFDANLPFRAHGVDPVVVAPPGCASATRDIIKCDVRVATQAVDVPGTPFTLAYTSARAAGAADRTLRIPVTGATMPAELMGAYVRVSVAGQTTEQQYAPAANITYEYVWDGNDAYGRPVQGNPTAVVEIGHLFPVDYMLPAQDAASFGLPCANTATNGVAACTLSYNNAYDTERHSFWRVSSAITKLGGLDAKAQGLGGFDFNVHHQYDPVGRVLYLGDGTTRIADAISPVVTTVYGKGCDGYSFDNIKATDACLFYPHRETIVAMPDGSFLVPNSGSIKRVRPDGISLRFAGDYPPCPPCYPDGAIHGEGGPATNATVGAVGPIALGPDGSVYAGSEAGGIERIVRISPDGILTRVAGGAGALAADGRPVQGTSLERIEALTVGPDGSVYFVQRTQEWRVYRIGPDSVIHTFAGIGAWGSGGDEQLAKQAQFTFIKALAFGPDGSLYIGQWDDFNIGNNRVRRVTPDGILHLVAGGGAAGGSGVPATQRALFRVQSLYVNAEGTVSIGAHNVVVQVTADGIFHVVAGDPTTTVFKGDGGPSLKAGFSLIAGVAELPDRSLLIYDADHHRVRKMAAPMPGFGGGAFLVASEDGNQYFSFDASGRHLRTLDARTGTLLFAFGYDAGGLLVTLTDARNGTLKILRDASGTPTELLAASGERTALTLVGGNLTAIVGTDAKPIRFEYTPDGLANRLTDKNGQVTLLTYDASGALLSQTTPTQRAATFTITPSATGTAALITSPSGRQTTLTSSNELDGARTLTSAVAGQTTRITTNPDGSVSTLLTDGSQITTVAHSDPIGGMLAPLQDATVRSPSGLTHNTRISVAVTRDPLTDDILQEVDSSVSNGHVREVLLDAVAGTARVTTPEGRRTYIDLDQLGRVVRDSSPGLVARRRYYDGNGRVSRVTQGSNTWTQTFDALGHVMQSTDALGRVQSFAWDAADRLKFRVGVAADTVRYGYDDRGALTSVTTPNGGVYRHQYDADGYQTMYAAPAVSGGGQAAETIFDQDHRIVGLVRPAGDTIRYAYNAFGQRTSVTTKSGTSTIAYSATSGRLTSLTTSDGEMLSVAYDGFLPTTFTWAGTVAGAVSQTYNADFRLSTQSVNGSNTINYTYDADGLLRTAGALQIARAGTSLVDSTIVGGVVTKSQYDSAAQLVGVIVRQGQATLLDIRYTRDAIGRITAASEANNGTTTIHTFKYDVAGQLTQTAIDGVLVAAYDYDPDGNRIRETRSSGVIHYTADAQDRVIAASGMRIMYAPGGELVKRSLGMDSTTYDYDEMGQLTSVKLPDATTIQYILDGTHRRIGRRINGALTTGYLYGGTSVIAEVDAAGAIVTRYVYATDKYVPDLMIRNGRTYRIVRDATGSVRRVIDVITGDVSQALEYDEFGKVISDTRPGFQLFGFSGGIYDPATQLVRLGARDYDPMLGRWMTQDPAGLASDEVNLYRFAHNSPLNLRDPTGLCDGTCSLVGQSMMMTMMGTMLANQMLGRPLTQDVIRNTAMVGLAAWGASAALPYMGGVLADWGFTTAASGPSVVALGKFNDVQNYVQETGAIRLSIPNGLYNFLGRSGGYVVNWAFIRFHQMMGSTFQLVSLASTSNLYDETRGGAEAAFGWEIRWLFFESPFFNVDRVIY